MLALAVHVFYITATMTENLLWNRMILSSVEEEKDMQFPEKSKSYT